MELALLALPPVMVVMLTLMRLLEARGILDRIVQWVSPLLSPLVVASIAILISAGPHVTSVLRPALLGGAVAIGLRTLIHYLWFF